MFGTHLNILDAAVPSEAPENAHDYDKGCAYVNMNRRS